MFDMSLAEIMLIAIIAILFLGPDKLPEAMVKIAKLIKSAKKAIGDAKHSLEEEMKIAELKEEAMNYKKQLDEATSELKSFKNVGINPMDDINEAVQSAKKTISAPAQDATAAAPETIIEPKRETVTFAKKSSRTTTEPASKPSEEII